MALDRVRFCVRSSRGPEIMSSPSAEAKKHLILCIDDAEVSLRIRKLLLSGAGYEVVTATSGEAGLEIFRHTSIDLVIADHFLTEKTGTEIAREMKALKPDIPILIVSAAAEKPEGVEFADGFVSKGEDPNSLLHMIADLLRPIEK